MKKNRFTIVILLMFLTGVCILLYPTISTYVNSKNASHLVANYQDTVELESSENIAQYFEQAEDYNKRLAADPNAFYFPSRLNGYQQTLDPIGIGVMGSIFIEKLKVELPIYHGTDPGVLQLGIGHIEGTSFPIGGEGTHAVLSGHRGLPSAKLFTDLDKLEIDDRFVITILDRNFTYRVDSIKTILPTESEDLLPVEGKDYCTLVTCTPYGINTHRLLVRGIRDDTAEKRPGIRVRNEAFQVDTIIVASIAAIPMILALLLNTFLKSGNPNAKKRIQHKHTRKP